MRPAPSTPRVGATSPDLAPTCIIGRIRSIAPMSIAVHLRTPSANCLKALIRHDAPLPALGFLVSDLSCLTYIL